MKLQKCHQKKQQLRDHHKEQVEALKQGWDDEKAMLLDVIQRDCNQIFEKQRSSAAGTKARQVSPRSVFDFEVPEVGKLSSSTGAEATHNSKPSSPSPVKELNPGNKLEPSSYSKIEEELRETEALVQSLLFGGSEG